MTDHRTVTVETRFWSKVASRAENACWAWLGQTNEKGYGRFWFSGRWVQAHRFAYERLVGPIGVDLTIDHLCRNRACVNPAHLEPVTNRENILRGTSPAAVAARRTHCTNGHPYSGANLFVERSGQRRCRTCDRETGRKRWSFALHPDTPEASE